ncbi:hypothetical protein [Sphingomonas sp. Root710]|uniref:hypothetical protein n=1 Tax=Sphingomonas sp. Root710 TaxID=1736594 RepID=UPI0012E3722B|nr:hypothetical protein [Sphingomonas sp. Root710]
MREHLIFKALVALQDTRSRSSEAIVQPSWTLRFCLAYLYTQSFGSRDPFEYFWAAMQDGHPTTTDGGSYLRHLNLGRAINSIIYGLGFNDTPQTEECLSRPRCGRAVHDFWEEVQRQLDDGRPMPERRFRRD